jgi:hypothetical protein
VLQALEHRGGPLASEARSFCRGEFAQISEPFEAIEAGDPLERVRDPAVGLPQGDEAAAGVSQAGDLEGRGRLDVEEPVENARRIRLDVALRRARKCHGPVASFPVGV